MTAIPLTAPPVDSDTERVDLHVIAATHTSGHRIGTLVGWSESEGPKVDYPDNPHGHIIAKTVVPLDEERVAALSAERRKVLLTFDAERSDSPIIVGLLQPTPREAKEQGSAAAESIDARIDGRRVLVEGKDEIALQCGKASLTLRRNGRVVVRGRYVETFSEGVNRIKGGTVHIN